MNEMKVVDHKLKVFEVPEGIIGHGAVFHEVTFREPRLGDYMLLGELQTVGYLANGQAIVTSAHEKVVEYLQRLLVKPADWLLIETQGSFALGRDIRNWILGFFQSGGAGSEPSVTSPGTSSSNAGSTQAP